MALPNKTFWCNYNARNYNSTTLTLPKENGQLFDNDLVFPSAVTYNDDHITISNNKKVSFIFNSTSENIFNRTTSTATITIIAKIANGRNMWFLANRLAGGSQIGWMAQYGSKYQMAYTGDSNSYTSSTSPMIFTWRCGNGTQQYIAHSDNVIGTPYQSTDWVGRESTAMHFFGGGDGGSEYWTGDFYWMYISPETLTDAEIQAVIDYNENPQTPLVQIPVNKYKLYTSNIQKTYNGSTQINKMYVGNNLVYRALPTTTLVDYVHTSTGNDEYISTGIYPTTDTVFRVVYKLNNLIGTVIVGFDDNSTPIKCSDDDTDYRYFACCNGNNVLFDFNTSRLSDRVTVDNNGYSDVTVGNNYITNNLSSTTVSRSEQSSVVTQNIPIYLNVSSDLDFQSLEIWQNNTKVYDGHAAVGNGVYGVYDSVSGVFTTQTYGGNSMTGGNLS